jgi:hypothetical protein
MSPNAKGDYEHEMGQAALTNERLTVTIGLSNDDH